MPTALICPRCGVQQTEESSCSSCGVDLSLGLELSTQPAVSPVVDSETKEQHPLMPEEESGDGQATDEALSSHQALEVSSGIHQTESTAAGESTLENTREESLPSQSMMPSSLDSTGEPPLLPSNARAKGSQSNRVRYLKFWGAGRSLFGVFLTNTFLSLITLGLYSFWGRVRVREYVNSQTSFAGSRFAYHGTGQELLIGWAKALGVFGLPYIFFSALPFMWKGVPEIVPHAIAGLLLLVFIPIAVVGAHRYRLSRTSLRNIRFSFRGRVPDYMKLWLKGSLLSVVTLGFYYPYFENARREFLVTHSYYGNQPFLYDGQGKDLLKIFGKASGLYLLTMIGIGSLLGLVVGSLSLPLAKISTVMMASGFFMAVLPVTALIVPWFYLQAARQRFFWAHTRFGEARFHYPISAWRLFELRLGHLALLLTTLGFTWPWVQIRNLQFMYHFLSLHGPVSFQAIEQEAHDASPTGEALAGFFDAGFDLG